jgi:hypothetical protein
MPATSINTDGGGAHRAVNADTGRSGAQLIATNTALSRTIAIIAPARIHINIFMACLFGRAHQGMMADENTVFRQS